MSIANTERARFTVRGRQPIQRGTSFGFLPLLLLLMVSGCVGATNVGNAGNDGAGGNAPTGTSGPTLASGDSLRMLFLASDETAAHVDLVMRLGGWQGVVVPARWLPVTGAGSLFACAVTSVERGADTVTVATDLGPCADYRGQLQVTATSPSAQRLRVVAALDDFAQDGVTASGRIAWEIDVDPFVIVIHTTEQLVYARTTETTVDVQSTWSYTYRRFGRGLLVDGTATAVQGQTRWAVGVSGLSIDPDECSTAPTTGTVTWFSGGTTAVHWKVGPCPSAAAATAPAPDASAPTAAAFGPAMADLVPMLTRLQGAFGRAFPSSIRAVLENNLLETQPASGVGTVRIRRIETGDIVCEYRQVGPQIRGGLVHWETAFAPAGEHRYLLGFDGGNGEERWQTVLLPITRTVEADNVPVVADERNLANSRPPLIHGSCGSMDNELIVWGSGPSGHDQFDFSLTPREVMLEEELPSGPGIIIALLGDSSSQDIEAIIRAAYDGPYRAVVGLADLAVHGTFGAVAESGALFEQYPDIEPTYIVDYDLAADDVLVLWNFRDGP